MNPPLWLNDTLQYAAEVFVGLFDVRSFCRESQFPRFKPVARFPFIGYLNRHNVEFGQRLYTIVDATAAKHTDQSGLRTVKAVLGASVALSYPYRLAARQKRVTQIARQL